MADVFPARPPWATRVAVISLILAAIFVPVGGFLLFQDGPAYWGYVPVLNGPGPQWTDIVFDSSMLGLGLLCFTVGLGFLQMRRWVWFELVGFIPLFMLISAYELVMGMASRPLGLVIMLGTCAYLLYVLFRPAVRTLFR